MRDRSTDVVRDMPRNVVGQPIDDVRIFNMDAVAKLSLRWIPRARAHQSRFLRGVMKQREEAQPELIDKLWYYKEIKESGPSAEIESCCRVTCSNDCSDDNRSSYEW